MLSQNAHGLCAKKPKNSLLRVCRGTVLMKKKISVYWGVLSSIQALFGWWNSIGGVHLVFCNLHTLVTRYPCEHAGILGLSP